MALVVFVAALTLGPSLFALGSRPDPTVRKGDCTTYSPEDGGDARDCAIEQAQCALADQAGQEFEDDCDDAGGTVKTVCPSDPPNIVDTLNGIFCTTQPSGTAPNQSFQATCTCKTTCEP